ncbi:aminoglycoside phosphotransferase family protein [Alicyclobacillus sendaiensis]|uniref:aminoglycoside phosphotransferase family protein n=1 Tax=Alicyclobacillus sendaiensis TaxID=192387 RepID=UPI0026F456FA|nr:aminoglycoside phosphotransferase family protein [Alicyclobacillus sendaiensis]
MVLARFADFFDQALSGILPRALLHGDLTHAHILYHPCVTEAIGIIDFGDVQFGDPAYDFAGLYWDYGPAFVQNVLDHYAAGQGKRDVHAFRARVVSRPAGRAPRTPSCGGTSSRPPHA